VAFKIAKFDIVDYRTRKIESSWKKPEWQQDGNVVAWFVTKHTPATARADVTSCHVKSCHVSIVISARDFGVSRKSLSFKLLQYVKHHRISSLFYLHTPRCKLDVWDSVSYQRINKSFGVWYEYFLEDIIVVVQSLHYRWTTTTAAILVVTHHQQ